MPDIPRLKAPDSTLSFLLDPYEFISKRARRVEADVFETRLLLERTLCMTGEEAARLFYDTERFTRANASPSRVKKTLFGEGGVQGIDGEAHRHRKQLFMDLMTAERVGELAAISVDAWDTAAASWAKADRIILFDETQTLLTRAVCRWAGVPLDEGEVETRSRELTALFNYAGSIGPAHWWSRRARTRAERWAAGCIDGARTGRIEVPEPTALHRIATARTTAGQPLPLETAAVELLNVLRPTVALSVYFVYVALALHQHPACRRKLHGGEDEQYLEWFVQEVRRYYPFFPAVPARVRRDFEWKGYRFRAGTRVILDLYGIDHDPRIWDAPGKFRPERFRDWKPNPFNFVPQGGGDHYANHRCPGEGITIELMKVATRYLVDGIDYTVPEQNLSVDRKRLPALPRSRFVLSDIEVRPERLRGPRFPVESGKRL